MKIFLGEIKRPLQCQPFILLFMLASRGEGTRKIIFTIIIFKEDLYLSKVIQADQVKQGYQVNREINSYTRRFHLMNKTKVEVCGEVLKDIFQNFEGAENFIKQRIEKICK